MLELRFARYPAEAMDATPEITRFAPSPTGYLHLGHARAALFAWRRARATGGRFLLRIEDIDTTRYRPEYEAAIFEDLRWLGLDWDGTPRRQSAHFAEYRKALDGLASRGLVYPCFCTRADIAREVAAAGAAPQGPDGPLYPGICRALPEAEAARRIAAGQPYALRLHMARACEAVAGPLLAHEENEGWHRCRPEVFGDVVLGRKDVPASYHLCVTHDDALQGITLVTRGDDLKPATDLHRLIQALMGWPAPRYAHHALMRDAAGRRLAKRDGAESLRALREKGISAAEVRAMAEAGQGWTSSAKQRNICSIKGETLMKIDHVSLTIFTWDNIPRTSYHVGSFTQPLSNLGLLRIRTDAGHEGHAFLGTASNPASMDGPQLMRWIKPLLMGANPLERERLHGRMLKLSRNVSYRCIGAADVALWDLAGKIAGLPVHALMGTERTSIGTYASSQLLPDAAAYVEQALFYKENGWCAYKIHPPTVPETDIKVCEAVRKAVGDDYPIMLDSTWSYDYYGALKVGLAIQEMGFKWYEDPLADEDILSYVKLRQKLNIPIMATEYPAGGLDTYPIWVTQQATDYLRGDIPNKGGLTTMLKTAHLAEAFRMNYEIHHSGNSLNNLANLHLALAIPNTTWFEVLLPDGAHRYGLAEEFHPDKKGMLHAPTGPGLGAKIDFDLIKRKTEGVLE